MVPQEQTMVASDLHVAIEWLDMRYVIHSNYPEIAKSFLLNQEVMSALQVFNEVCSRFEIYRGLLTLTIREPELSRIAPRNLPQMIDALVVLARIYEAGSLVKITILPMFSMCPYCRDEFQDTLDRVSCSKCSTILHQVCWLENGQCTTWGCDSTPSSTQKSN
jgi:hypothetical protein